MTVAVKMRKWECVKGCSKTFRLMAPKNGERQQAVHQCGNTMKAEKMRPVKK